MKKRGMFILTSILLTVLAYQFGPFFLAAVESLHTQPRRTGGYVPNEETAIAIAVAVWRPLYGYWQIMSERPFQARLTNGVWQVRGTFHGGGAGGAAIAEISESNGCLLRVTHGK